MRRSVKAGTPNDTATPLRLCGSILYQIASLNFIDRAVNAIIIGNGVIVGQQQVVEGISLGYSKVVVETPVHNEDGSLLLKRGKKVADTTKCDTESIPLTEEIDEYIAREVLPYNPDAWVDESKTKIGYEIPFTRMFYEYTAIEPSADIAARIAEREQSLMAKLHELFREV